MNRSTAGFTDQLFDRTNEKRGNMGTTSWRGQILRALQAINHIGESSHAAKRAQDWKPGMAVKGLYSYGTFNAVFDRAVTFTNWLDMRYPGLKIFLNVEREMTAEFLQEKSLMCTTNTLQALVAALRKLQEGLHAMNWIGEDIVPEDWKVQGAERPRGAYAPAEAAAIMHWVALRSPEYGQALRFILSSGARIDEVLHLRADKIDIAEKRVQLLGKGGRLRKIRVLHVDVLQELDLSRRFVYLKEEQGDRWKDGLERYVRQACDVLGIQRHGVHGFRATAACEFMVIKRAMGYTEMEARKELAMWLGHNPHRTDVTYAYVPRGEHAAAGQ